jgi:DNA-binding MarR family transcriptional regulator
MGVDANKKDLFETMHQHLHSLVNKHKTLYRIPHDYSLSGSEMQVIDVVGNSSMANVTEIAAILGITKASASEMIGKLHKRGCIRKFREEGNKRDVYVTLTEKGCAVHVKYKDRWGENCANFLNHLTTEQIGNFNQVAGEINKMVSHEIKIRLQKNRDRET